MATLEAPKAKRPMFVSLSFRLAALSWLIGFRKAETTHHHFGMSLGSGIKSCHRRRISKRIRVSFARARANRIISGRSLHDSHIGRQGGALQRPSRRRCFLSNVRRVSKSSEIGDFGVDLATLYGLVTGLFPWG